MAKIDSVDKIVESYLACITNEPFKYKKKNYQPKPLRVSAKLFRGFTCPENCGACCPCFSLDYLPWETKPEGAIERTVEVNGKQFQIFSDRQLEHNDHHCKYLNKENARCRIHCLRPFSCDFELIRFSTGKKYNQLNQRKYGRAWQMKRAGGIRGCLCDITQACQETQAEVLRKMYRLKEWADYFNLSTKINTIIEYVKTGPHIESVIIEK